MTRPPPRLPRPPRGGTPTIALLAAAALVLACLSISGQMRPWMTPDSAGWLDPCGQAGCWAGPRTPLYAWLAAGGAFAPLLPWLQFAALVAAAWWLARGLRRLGASARGALAVGLAIITSNLAILWTRALLPELFAHAAMLAAVAATLHLAADGGAPALSPAMSTARSLGAAGLLAGLGYLLKPGLILMAPLLGALCLWLAPRRRARAAALLGASLLPFLLVASWRLATLGDFNIVSFAGFQMSGLAALMLTPQIAARLPPDPRAAAEAIIARRDALTSAGRAPPVPLNSRGERSFVSAAVFYFDVLARAHDDVLYGAVAPGRRAGESWVAFDARMRRLALATIEAAPLDYAAWTLGALTRLVGHALVLNPAFVLGCLGWLAVSARRTAPAPAGEVPLLGAVTAIWTCGTALPVIFLTFPAARYIDSSCLMLAAWPLRAVLIRLPSARGAGPVG